MKIEKFEEFNKVNEGAATLALIIAALRTLVVLGSNKLKMPDSTLDSELTNELSKISGIKSPNVYSVIRDKKKSPIACALPNSIYYDKVLKKILTHRELMSILLHELAHIQNKDSIKKFVMGIFPFIPIIMLDSWLVYFLLPFANNILFNRPIQRKHELNADSFAGKFGYGEDLSSALVKVDNYFKEKKESKEDDEIMRSIRKLTSLLNTHPSTLERIKKLRFYSEESPEDFIKRIEKSILIEKDDWKSIFR